jgi:hypothetical protein
LSQYPLYVRHISEVAVPKRTNPMYVRRRGARVQALLAALHDWAQSARPIIDGFAEESDEGVDPQGPVGKE